MGKRERGREGDAHRREGGATESRCGEAAQRRRRAARGRRDAMVFVFCAMRSHGAGFGASLGEKRVRKKKG